MIVDEAEPFISEFPTFVRSHERKKACDIKALAAAVGRLQTMPLDEFGAGSEYDRQRVRSQAVETCVHGYLASRLSQTLPVLDPSLFARRRWIGLRFVDGGAPEIFASVLTKPEGARIDGESPERWVDTRLLTRNGLTRNSNKSVSLGSVPWPRRARTTATVYSRFPGTVGSEQMKFGDKALACFHRALADMLDHSGLASFARRHVPEPELAAYWIPTLRSIYVREEVKPERRDPALVLEVCGHSFLCCLWDVAEEEPLEALIREFSVGGSVNMSDADLLD